MVQPWRLFWVLRNQCLCYYLFSDIAYLLLSDTQKCHNILLFQVVIKDVLQEFSIHLTLILPIKVWTSNPVRHFIAAIRVRDSFPTLRYTNRQCTYTRKPYKDARSCNHFCSRKAISITHSECVFVALVIQHAIRLRRIVLSLVSCHIFPHYLTKCRIFGGKKIEHITCFDFIHKICLKISHSKKKWTRYYHR